MELPSEEGEMPIPISSAYVQAGHILPPFSTPQFPSNGPILPSAPLDHNDQNALFKKVTVRYRECLKNHAAPMGGNATDGCGEFMPSGEEGSLEALSCSACNCHRNFHRKEVEGEHSSWEFLHQTPHHLKSFGRKLMLGGVHHQQQGILGNESFGYPGSMLLPSRPAQPPHQMIMSSYNLDSLPSESDEDGVNLVISRPQEHLMMKKRYRTKFTPEQKEKMLQFAEKVGWKIQKQEESVVHQFCQEIGVKRRVLKVWMHNNKLNLAKKSNNSNVQSQ